MAHIFSAPSGETVRRMRRRFRGTRVVRTSCITVPSLVGLGLSTPTGGVGGAKCSIFFFVRHGLALSKEKVGERHFITKALSVEKVLVLLIGEGL